MAVSLNVNNFKSLIKKSTVNHVIDNIKMVFTPRHAISAMRGTDLISVVRLENNILTGLKKADEIDFCFVNPLSNVLPYLDILRAEQVGLVIEDGYIELKESPHTVKISLFHQNVVTPFDADRQPNIDFFVSFRPDEQFANFIDKTKRVCATHGRIFIGTKDGFLYVRAGGAANELASEIKLNLVESDFEDVELNFNYKSFINLIGLIDQDFNISVSYDTEQELGLLRVENADKSEIYYIMSRI
jgi:hypothetical protein